MIAKQPVTLNGELFHIPFVVGYTQCGHVLNLINLPEGREEYALFNADRVELGPEAILPGFDEELTLELRVIH
jgi:hypothetical protein